MEWAAEDLRAAVQAGDVRQVRRQLADAPQLAAAADELGRTAAHFAAAADGEAGLAALRMVLDVDPSLAAAPSHTGDSPLHYAAACGNTAAARLLLGAAPCAAQLAASANAAGALALHDAAASGCEAMVQLLLQAAPNTVSACTNEGNTPLDFAFSISCPLLSGALTRTARLLIAAPGQQPSQLLQCLNRHGREALPLYSEVAGRYPLTPLDWQLIPSPCPCLAAALPGVLQRSTAEAALLIARLPVAERCRLRAAALSLHRAQADSGVWLPQPLVWRILAACLS